MSGYLPWGNVVQTGIAIFFVGVLMIGLSHLHERR